MHRALIALLLDGLSKGWVPRNISPDFKLGLKAAVYQKMYDLLYCHYRLIFHNNDTILESGSGQSYMNNMRDVF